MLLMVLIEKLIRSSSILNHKNGKVNYLVSVTAYLLQMCDQQSGEDDILFSSPVHQ